ncbi:murein biosynthesis integral membrane protein MurJ, partial [Streptomyces microflavus]
PTWRGRSRRAGESRARSVSALPKTARWAGTGALPAGALAAAGAGAAAVVLTFVLLARPLRLAELNALLLRVRRRAPHP